MFKIRFLLPVKSLIYLLAFLVMPFSVYGKTLSGKVQHQKHDNPNVARSKIGVGIHWPGLGIRYMLNERYTVELRGEYENDIVVTGLRGYKYFNSKEKVLFFACVEGDYINFKSEQTQGEGFAGGMAVGGEYFMERKLSFQFDFGPLYIWLKDKDFYTEDSGIAYVANLGLNFYFGK